MFLVIQEVFQLHIFQSTQWTIVPPVNGDLKLPCLKHTNTLVLKEKKKSFHLLKVAFWIHALTLSSSTVKVWSQACSPTVFQTVCPTTVLSSFRTALTSAAKNTTILHLPFSSSSSHYDRKTHLQDSSSVLLAVFPLTDPVRPYSPLLPLMNDLVSPGL